MLATIRNNLTYGELFTHDAQNLYVHLGIVHPQRIKLAERIQWHVPNAQTAELLAKHQATLSEQAA